MLRNKPEEQRHQNITTSENNATTLRKMAAHSSERLIKLYQPIWRHVPQK